MLSNLASYLLGYAEPSVPTNIDDDITLTAVETEDDDWIMIEKSEEAEKENEVVKEERALSRSSSVSSLPCPSLEESWFITPPPCFTSTGIVMLEISPMENLLIEHPSMSVYHRLGPVRGHQGDTVPDTAAVQAAPRSRSLSPAPSTGAPAPTPLRQIHSPTALYSAQRLQLITAQKLQNFKSSQGLKRNQLDRGNKVREVNNRNKRHCRKDKQKNHSGANNNRKCC